MVTFCAVGNNKRVSKRRNRATGWRAMLPPGGSVDSWYMMRAVRQPFPSCFRRSQKEVQKRRESSLQINVRGIAGSAFEQQAYLAQTCPPAPGSDRYRPLASAERRGLLYAWKKSALPPVAPEGRRARLPSSLRRPRGNSGGSPRAAPDGFRRV